MKRWGEHLSPWQKRGRQKPFGYLQGDKRADTAVVGGGITGLTTALRLQEAGKNVILITDGQVGEGSTGSSTGHLAEVLDKDFSSLISKFGMSSMNLVTESVRQSIDHVEKWIRQFRIQCRFKRLSGFKFAEKEEEAGLLKVEVEHARRLELPLVIIENNPLPFPIALAAKIEGQAQFDPFSYVLGLAQIFVQNGGEIFERSHVIGTEDGKPCLVHTALGTVVADEVVLATHTPVGLFFSLQTRVAPYSTYVIGAKLKKSPEPGLYWDMSEPYNYLRGVTEDRSLWLMGGRDHKTGQEPHPMERYLELEEYIHDHFQIEEMSYYWGHEYFESVDGLPFIGRIPFTKSIFTGTGYSGTGLTFGTVAGILISDLILGKANPWSQVYDPSRMKPFASASSFLKENANVAKWMLSDRLAHNDLVQLESLPPLEGMVVDIENQKLAVYKDENYQIIALSPVCTHLGCIVHWNSAEKTWDCPCHGGRYRADGEVFSGPPLRDLEKAKMKTQKVEPEPALGSRLLDPFFNKCTTPENPGLDLTF